MHVHFERLSSEVERDLSDVCFSIEGERATMVRQLQRDVDMTEQASLQVLEHGF